MANTTIVDASDKFKTAKLKSLLAFSETSLEEWAAMTDARRESELRVCLLIQRMESEWGDKFEEDPPVRIVAGTDLTVIKNVGVTTRKPMPSVPSVRPDAAHGRPALRIVGGTDCVSHRVVVPAVG